MKTPIKKTQLAKELGCTHSAIVQWEKNGRIPAQACMKLEEILEIPAKRLYEEPHILFSMFNGAATSTQGSRAVSGKITHEEKAC